MAKYSRAQRRPGASEASTSLHGLHATTVEVEVIVMVLVMVMVVVMVSPAVVVAVTVAAEVVSSVLPQPCKDSEAMKPKQMARNARASCMITTGSTAGTKSKCCLTSLQPKRPQYKLVKLRQLSHSFVVSCHPFTGKHGAKRKHATDHRNERTLYITVKK